MSMDIKIDKIDEQILLNLQRYDAPRTPNEMACELGISSSTVRRRVKRLTNAGIVSIIALVDPENAGLSLVTVLGIHITGEPIDTITRNLINRIEITWLATSVGKFDIMAIARFATINDMGLFVHSELPSIKGISGIETFLCIDEVKTVRVTR